MKKILLFLAVITITAFSGKTYAWGTTGHRVIAEIAERNLSNNAKKEINLLLNNQHMAYWANWADYIKSDTTQRWSHTHVWHYVNAEGNTTKDQFIESVKGVQQENLYGQIVALTNVIKSTSSTTDEKREALIFLIHLVGDLHQPMHVGKAEDLGGNRIPVQWFREQTNLHSLWDSKLVDFEKYSYTEYATVLNVISDKQKAALQAGVLEDWLYESHTIADRLYEITPLDASLSFEYNYKVRPIVDGQLQKGGLRLAKILNDLF